MCILIHLNDFEVDLLNHLEMDPSNSIMFNYCHWYLIDVYYDYNKILMHLMDYKKMAYITGNNNY